MSTPTYTDDCERLIRILADAPTDGLSMDEIQAETMRTGEKWSLRTINTLLCDLRPRVAFQKLNVKGRKVTKYTLKRAS